jgi:hypothetical protein
MDEITHPLLTRRMGGALAVLGTGFGLGLALISFAPFLIRALGMAIVSTRCGPYRGHANRTAKTRCRDERGFFGGQAL